MGITLTVHDSFAEGHCGTARIQRQTRDIARIGNSAGGNTRWIHDAPADALHDEFRLRFRAATDLDQWDIDNVSVQSGRAGGCDRIITSADLASWETCATGPGGRYSDVDCSLLDQNGDGKIDLRDFRLMQNAWLGL